MSVAAHERNLALVLGGNDAARALLDQRVRDGDDVGGGAVVAREVQDQRVRPGGHDLVEERRRGAVEAVDRLVRVTDAEQIRIVAGDLAQQQELQGVHVLGLVDVERTVAVTKCGEHVGFVAQHRYGFGEQQVEVQHAATRAESDVAVQHLGELRRRRGASRRSRRAFFA